MERAESPLQRAIRQAEDRFDYFAEDLIRAGVPQAQIDMAFNYTETRIRREFAARDAMDPLIILQTMMRVLGDEFPDEERLLMNYFYQINGRRQVLSETKKTKEVMGPRIYRKDALDKTIGGAVPVLPLLWTVKDGDKEIYPSVDLKTRMLQKLGVLEPGVDLEDFRLSMEVLKNKEQSGDPGLGVEFFRRDGQLEAWITGIETNISGVELRMQRLRTDVIDAVLLPECFERIQSPR